MSGVTISALIKKMNLELLTKEINTCLLYTSDKEEIRANWQLQRSFMPSIGETKRKQKLKGWKKAVRCALFWANDEEE